MPALRLHRASRQRLGGADPALTPGDEPIPGIGGIAELRALIERGAAPGSIHVEAGKLVMTMPGLGAFGTPAIDLASHPDARERVFAVLRRHGIDPPRERAVRVDDPRIQAEILQALQPPP